MRTAKWSVRLCSATNAIASIWIMASSNLSGVKINVSRLLLPLGGPNPAAPPDPRPVLTSSTTYDASYLASFAMYSIFYSKVSFFFFLLNYCVDIYGSVWGLPRYDDQVRHSTAFRKEDNAKLQVLVNKVLRSVTGMA